MIEYLDNKYIKFVIYLVVFSFILLLPPTYNIWIGLVMIILGVFIIIQWCYKNWKHIKYAWSISGDKDSDDKWYKYKNDNKIGQ